MKAYQESVQELIKKRIDAIVDELLTALAEHLKKEPPEHWRSRFLGKEMTDEDLKRLFKEEVEGEVRRVKTDFNPTVFTSFKEVTYYTFKDEGFRKLLMADSVKMPSNAYSASTTQHRRSQQILCPTLTSKIFPRSWRTTQEKELK